MENKVAVNLKIINGIKFISLPELIKFLQSQLIDILETEESDSESTAVKKIMAGTLKELITSIENTNNN